MQYISWKFYLLSLLLLFLLFVAFCVCVYMTRCVKRDETSACPCMKRHLKPPRQADSILQYVTTKEQMKRMKRLARGWKSNDERVGG